MGGSDTMKLFCGIDWAEAHHDVAIVDENGHHCLQNQQPFDEAKAFPVLMTAAA
jgi:hypothetical protein